MSSSPSAAILSLMRTAKAAILAAMALFAPAALASAVVLDHSISPAPGAIHSSLAIGVNAARSVSCVAAAGLHFASHPETSADTAHAAATPKPAPETPNTPATPKRSRGTYGMALAGLALLGFIARRRHRVLNATA